VLAFHGGPRLSQGLKAQLQTLPPAAQALIKALDARMLLATTPGIHLRLGAPGLSPQALEASLGALEAYAPGMQHSLEPGGYWRISIPELKESLGAELRALHREGVLELYTPEAQAGDFREGSGLDPQLFKGAFALLYLRAAGAPHNGQLWFDALSPSLGILGVSAEQLRELCSAAAYLSAHLGELGISLRAQGPHLEAALEVILL